MPDLADIPLAVDVLRLCRCSDCQTERCGFSDCWQATEWKYCLEYRGPVRSREVILIPQTK